MFNASSTPRVFASPLGSDFPRVLVEGLRARFQGKPPQDIAQVQLIVNTRRMERRVRLLFDEGPPTLLPRVRLLTDFGRDALAHDIPAPVSPLRRRFELVRLVSELLEAQPDLAARASLYDLADSLANLMSEMSGEGVSADAIDALDVSDQSGHWERAKTFFGIARRFVETVDDTPDAETRQRRVIERLEQEWQVNPPRSPVILAGSTGSRGTTLLLMKAIARLPQGAIVLPGFDFDMPDPVWDALSDGLTSEDHPQFRFRHLMDALGLGPADVTAWHAASIPSPARNRLVSLALRPAPVTDQWRAEGPDLIGIPEAASNMTLLEAASLREEALAIALRLRKAAEDGTSAALITPDRMLTRQVTAALDRWDITPDDSAGTPLQLSPPGRFLRHVSRLFQQKLTAEALLTLLKHPLCHSGEARNTHLLRTRDLELFIRREGVTFPDPEALGKWSATRDSETQDWTDWVTSHFCNKETAGDIAFGHRLTAHISLAEAIAQGSDAGAGALWDKAAGRQAARLVGDLKENAIYAGPISAADYTDMFGAVLATGEVRDRDQGHPHILIWGTLEARVQGADLVILGGLNEGSWPEAPSPDPWLNRKMRHDAGLLLPERRVGLSAHDFQQAIAAPEVWLTRSIRSDEAETVPSRWVNRLTNLMAGLPEQGGTAALAGMRDRGQTWLAMVAALEHVDETDPASRPSPRPPLAARPNRLSVTEIKKLIRDPYAIYARHVLRLRSLDSLMKTPDALLRGIIVHEILETFVKDVEQDESLLTQAHLMQISETVLAQNVPWPTARALWSARLERVAGHFVDGETRRRHSAKPVAHERKAKITIPEPPFTLVAKADRIDRREDGTLAIYDYKTGRPPSQEEQIYFDKQLLLEAAMAEQGGFVDIPPSTVAEAIYLGLGSTPKDEPAPLNKMPAMQVWDEFIQLITHYCDPENGFTARRAMHSDRDNGEFDQLSRFGEWDATDSPVSEDLE